MADRGQRTKITIGAVTADVSLVPVSSTPSSARWETRTAPAEGEVLLADEGVVDATAKGADPTETAELSPGLEVVTTQGDPLGAMPPAGMMPILPQNVAQARLRDELAASSTPTTTTRGVTNDAGEFVDLTDALAEIDERVKIDGLQVIRAIAPNQTPRERVRGASFVSPAPDATPTTAKVLALLYDALQAANRGLVVRWTKRTNQALGLVVASKAHGALLLYELEFAAAMKAAPAPARAAVALELTERERHAARELVASLEGPAATLDEIDDERRVLHAELIAKAKAGETFELPPVADAIDDELAALLAGAAS